MLIEAIKLGDKLNIKQLDVKSEKEYASKLLDIKEDGIISIAMPIEKNRVVIMDIGSKYQVIFYTAKGLFASEAVVIERYKVQRLYVAELRILTEPTKFQRREFFRFQCIMDVNYCVMPQGRFHDTMQQLNKEESTSGLTKLQKKVRVLEYLKDLDAKNETQLIQIKKGMITDISGGGMKLKAEEEIHQDKEIYLCFSLNQGLSNINVFGEIISSEKSLVRSNLYEHRLKYTDISKEEREQIVRYVLNEERKLRQKEKGFC